MQVDQFVYITDHTYTRDEVLATEEQVLDVLNFELTQPTAKTFLRRFIQVCKPAALESCVHECRSSQSLQCRHAQLLQQFCRGS
jgi:Cyclin, N-terminal domain